jgi:glutamyl-tRNA reductase
MQLLTVGINHKTAPVALRERVALSGEQAAALSAKLAAMVAAQGSRAEAIVVSTCNRVECYVASPTPCVAQRAITEALSERGGLPAADLAPHLYAHQDDAALRHLFRVVSSLDSMVVGEPQITGQVKQAYQAAVDAHAVGAYLHRVMHEAFHIAKRVRTETGIGEHAVSMSFLAVELARQILGKLTGKRALLLGAGKMSTLAARHLHAQGIQDLRITNRSPQRAEALAATLGGRACPIEHLPTLLTEVDIVISSTNAPSFVLSHADITRTMRARRGRPLFLIDLAVPRDIEPSAHQIENVFLYDVDDMQQVLRDNVEARQREAASAERLIAAEVESFVKRLRQGDAVPTIVALREHHTQVAQGELAAFLRKHPELSDAQRQDVERLLSGVVNKLLHAPSAALKRAAQTPDSDHFISTARALFDLSSSAASATHSAHAAPAARLAPALQPAPLPAAAAADGPAASLLAWCKVKMRLCNQQSRDCHQGCQLQAI